MKAYFFSTVAPLLQEPGVIDLGVGSPDLPPPPKVIEALQRVSGEPGVHGYAPHAGMFQLRVAFSEWMKNRFGVKVDAESEVLPLLGSKEGIVHFSMAVLKPGDIVLVPNPGYVPFSFGAKVAQAKVVEFDLLSENNWLPDIKQIEELTKRCRPKLLWLNYPNNPTGAVMDMELLQKLVELARQEEFVIGYDTPYCELGFDGYQAHSILEITGAKEVAIEFHSFSKTYHMAGWRVGMAIGNSGLIKKLLEVKSNIDSGMFKPVQLAAVEALNTPKGWLVERKQILRRRRDAVVNLAKELGWQPVVPKAGLYVWAKLPTVIKNDREFCLELLKAKGVFITPGSVFGSNGGGWVRIALTQSEEKIIEAGKRMVPS